MREPVRETVRPPSRPVLVPDTIASFGSSGSHHTVPSDAPAAENPAPKTVGRWQNTGSDTITDDEFWAYLRNELR